MAYSGVVIILFSLKVFYEKEKKRIIILFVHWGPVSFVLCIFCKKKIENLVTKTVKDARKANVVSIICIYIKSNMHTSLVPSLNTLTGDEALCISR